MILNITPKLVSEITLEIEFLEIELDNMAHFYNTEYKTYTELQSEIFISEYEKLGNIVTALKELEFEFSSVLNN